MPESEIENQKPESSPPKRRSRLTTRNLVIVAILGVLIFAALFITSLVSYRYGVFDTYLKTSYGKLEDATWITPQKGGALMKVTEVH